MTITRNLVIAGLALEIAGTAPIIAGSAAAADEDFVFTRFHKR